MSTYGTIITQMILGRWLKAEAQWSKWKYIGCHCAEKCREGRQRSRGLDDAAGISLQLVQQNGTLYSHNRNVQVLMIVATTTDADGGCAGNGTVYGRHTMQGRGYSR
jgi:hypothetical protein